LIRHRSALRRIARQFSKQIIIAVAIALLICPDPFSDILALGLIGKVGVSINFRGLTGRRKIFKGDPLPM